MSTFVRDIRRAMAQMVRDAEIPGLVPEHVYTNRVRPLSDEKMPCVCIFSTAEEVNEGQSDDAPRVYMIEADIAVAIYVKTDAGEDPDEDDKLDDFAQVLRNLFGENDTIQDEAAGSAYQGCEWIMTAEGAVSMGAVVLRYKVQYREEQPGPDRGNLDNLRLIHVDYDGAPKPDGKIDASDDIRFTE